MFQKLNVIYIFLFIAIVGGLSACKQKYAAKEKKIVLTPEQMDKKVSENINAVLLFAKDNDGKINDSILLARFPLVIHFYEKNNFKSIWSSKESWLPIADSLFHFIKNSRYFGLYPSDYHYNDLDKLRTKIKNDSLALMDAINWTKGELMLTDAFVNILKDVKEGRLVADSNSIVKKEIFIDSFFVKNIVEAIKYNNVDSIFKSVEPVNTQYHLLRMALKGFVDSMDYKDYLFIHYPYKDSLSFVKNIHKRLLQSGYGNPAVILPDSATFVHDLKRYQKDNKLIVDGIAGPGVTRSLNFNDKKKFESIAITLDRYKKLPELPSIYIWVNIPAFKLQVWSHDTVVLESKVIVGKPSTPTPVLKSKITDMVTYPTWTVPASIIRKDILPQLKVDPGYLFRKGFSIVDSKGETVNPFSVNWEKYSKWIPWRVVQGSGDDNALGVFKFNFSNPYSVYLHDTNQRYLFNNANRALSHGCVRVKKWEKLAFYIARLDSIATIERNPLVYNADSIEKWIDEKARKRIMVKKKLPLYIEYFTCEAVDGSIVFYKDIYKKEEHLSEKYF